MANFDFSVASGVTPAMGTAVNIYNSAIILQPTTATPLIIPIFSSILGVGTPYVPSDLGALMIGLSKSISMHTPRRPSSGQLYPRGNQ